MAEFKASQDTKEKIRLFEEADKLFKREWNEFEDEHSYKLQRLEALRDDRNAKLDEAKRSLRAELETVDALRLSFTEGPFKVQKKWSDFYRAEKLVALLTDRGLYDAAISAGVVALKVETGNYEEVKKFLQAHNVEKEFECCEDGKEAGSAISGPKQVPPLAAELKKE